MFFASSARVDDTHQLLQLGAVGLFACVAASAWTEEAVLSLLSVPGSRCGPKNHTFAFAIFLLLLSPLPGNWGDIPLGDSPSTRAVWTMVPITTDRIVLTGIVTLGSGVQLSEYAAIFTCRKTGVTKVCFSSLCSCSTKTVWRMFVDRLCTLAFLFHSSQCRLHVHVLISSNEIRV